MVKRGCVVETDSQTKTAKKQMIQKQNVSQLKTRAASNLLIRKATVLYDLMNDLLAQPLPNMEKTYVTGRPEPKWKTQSSKGRNLDPDESQIQS